MILDSNYKVYEYTGWFTESGPWVEKYGNQYKSITIL